MPLPPRLYDPVTVMFFFRNKHMMIDLGTGVASACACIRSFAVLSSSGNNNKVNWAMNDKQAWVAFVCFLRVTRSYVPYNQRASKRYNGSMTVLVRSSLTSWRLSTVAPARAEVW